MTVNITVGEGVELAAAVGEAALAWLVDVGGAGVFSGVGETVLVAMGVSVGIGVIVGVGVRLAVGDGVGVKVEVAGRGV